MKRLVAGIGELLWDVLPGGRELGGAPGNFAWHVHALGMTGLIVSCVGDDDEGREILERLRALGLRSDHVSVDPAHPTGRSTVSLDASGVPSFHVHEDVAWDFIPFTPTLARVAEEIDAVNFGTLGQRTAVSRGTTRSVLTHTRPDAIRLFDLNLRPPHYTREVIAESLTIASVVKLNESELGVVSRMFGFSKDEPTALNELAEQFALRLVALTRGEKGSVLWANGRTSVHRGFESKVVDTVGAGDAFAAALVVGMLEGFDLDRINEHANRVASYVCSKPGATPELPAELANRP
jgi:fructokinase